MAVLRRNIPDESEESRFKQHNRYLSSLREDTLLIMDNFNVTVPGPPPGCDAEIPLQNSIHDPEPI